MTRARPTLDLYPELCDACGRCERACPGHALKAGNGYLYVDWERCDGCGDCAGACDRDAIRLKASARRETAPSPRAPAAAGRDANARHAAPAAPGLDPALDAACPVRWSLPEAAAVLAAVLALFVAEEVVLGSAWVADLKPGAAGVARLLVIGAYYVAQLGVLAMLVRRRGAPLMRGFGLSGVGTRAGHKAASAAVGALALMAALAAAWAWGRLAGAVGWLPPERLNSDVTALFGGDVGGLLFTLALTAALGPFVEELAFRGVVMDAIGRRWGTVAAIAGSSALFGLFHFSLWQFVPAALLGAALAWLTQRRGSLWPAILVHCAYNAVPVLAAFWLNARGGA